MPGGCVSLALAARLCLPRLRQAEALRHQDPQPLPVPVLPTADLADRRHDFASTKVPLRTRFRAMYPPDAEQGRDLQPRTRLGVTQNTAWKLAHKLMRVMMERDAGKRLTGRVEIDDASLGGGRSGGKRGRGAPGKTPIIVAMETNARGPAGAPEAAPGRRRCSGVYPIQTGRHRQSVQTDRHQRSLPSFLENPSSHNCSPHSASSRSRLVVVVGLSTHGDRSSDGR